MPPKSSNGKGGRRPRKLSPGEVHTLAEFSGQLQAHIDKLGGNFEKTADQLGVCRAVLYRYLQNGKHVMPGFHTLKRAHDQLGFQFKYFNFDVEPPKRGKRTKVSEVQGVLPFLQALKQENIQVVGKKQVGSQTLELTVHIRFTG